VLISNRFVELLRNKISKSPIPCHRIFYIQRCCPPLQASDMSLLWQFLVCLWYFDRILIIPWCIV